MVGSSEKGAVPRNIMFFEKLFKSTRFLKLKFYMVDELRSWS